MVRSRFIVMVLTGILTCMGHTFATERPQSIPLSASDSSFWESYFNPTTGFDRTTLIQYALTHNPRLKALRERQAEARGRLRQEHLYPNPSLDFEYARGSFLGSPQEQELTFELFQPILVGGKRRWRIKSAEIFMEIVKRELANAKRELIADVSDAYVRVLAEMENYRMTAELLNINEKALRLVATRVEKGESPKLEVSLLRVEVNRLRTDLIRIRNTIETTMLRLKQLLGWDIQKPLKFKERMIFPPTPFDLPPLDDLLQLAVQHRPDMQQIQKLEELSKAEVSLAKAEAFPDLGIFFRFTRTTSRFDALGLTPQRQLTPLVDTDRILTFGVSLELPFWNRNQGTIAARKAQREAVREQLNSIRLQVYQEVTAAWERYQTALEMIKVFKNGILQQANKNLQIVRTAYELGELRMLDVIAEQRRLIEIQREYIDVLREYYRSRIELERAVALPFQTIMKSLEGKDAP